MALSLQHNTVYIATSTPTVLTRNLTRVTIRKKIRIISLICTTCIACVCNPLPPRVLDNNRAHLSVFLSRPLHSVDRIPAQFLHRLHIHIQHAHIASQPLYPRCIPEVTRAADPRSLTTSLPARHLGQARQPSLHKKNYIRQLPPLIFLPATRAKHDSSLTTRKIRVEPHLSYCKYF